MGMDWLKGLVGSSDQMVPAGQAVPGAPAWGPQPYGAPQGGPGYGQQGGYGQPEQAGYGAGPSGSPELHPSNNFVAMAIRWVTSAWSDMERV